MAAMQHFTTEQALEIGNKLGIDWGGAWHTGGGRRRG